MPTFRVSRRLVSRSAAHSSSAASWAQLQQQQEAADDSSSTPLGTIFGGPLIGTHLGDPIG